MDPSLFQILVGAAATIIVAAITSLLSLKAVRVQESRQAKETDTDNAQKVSDMAVKLLEPYEEQLAKLQKKIEAQQTKIEAQDKIINELQCDLRAAREASTFKDRRIVEMQIEIDGLRAKIEALENPGG